MQAPNGRGAALSGAARAFKGLEFVTVRVLDLLRSVWEYVFTILGYLLTVCGADLVRPLLFKDAAAAAEIRLEGAAFQE